jgi:voltage-gated potassium channel
MTVLGGILLVGTLGFIIIEGASFFDSLYMVVITVTTVGFAEVFELSGLGRVWAMVIVFFGLGFTFYTALAAIEYVFDIGEERKKTRMQREINELSGHVVICGYGRVGRNTVKHLAGNQTSVVMVEIDPERAELAREAGLHVVEGDATHNDVLVRAGIDKAEAVIACVDADSDNLVIALSVKAIRPDRRVICRASDTESERKLLLAGADGVVAPQHVGAERLAALAVQPELAQIFDVMVDGRPIEFLVEELDIPPGCALDGETIESSGIRRESGALVLAVEDQKINIVVNPGPDLRLKAGDRIVVVGTKQQVTDAAAMLAVS